MFKSTFLQTNFVGLHYNVSLLTVVREIMLRCKFAITDRCRPVLLRIALFTALFSCGVVPAAHAYLDPGTGSFILQTLIAALFGALFVLKSYWVRIKGWFSGSSDTDSNAVESSAGDDPDARQKLSENSGAQQSGDGADKPDEH